MQFLPTTFLCNGSILQEPEQSLHSMRFQRASQDSERVDKQFLFKSSQPGWQCRDRRCHHRPNRHCSERLLGHIDQDERSRRGHRPSIRHRPPATRGLPLRSRYCWRRYDLAVVTEFFFFLAFCCIICIIKRLRHDSLKQMTRWSWPVHRNTFDRLITAVRFHFLAQITGRNLKL